VKKTTLRYFFLNILQKTEIDLSLQIWLKGTLSQGTLSQGTLSQGTLSQGTWSQGVWSQGTW